MELLNGKCNKFFTLAEESKNRYYKEDYNANDYAYNNYVNILAQEVKENSIVLDIGCAQGRFGKTLKEKNCVVYGIEIDGAAADFAKKSGYYDDVFITDLNDTQQNEYKRFIEKVNKIDTLIIADVLEHLTDPTGVLLKYSGMLTAGGKILISVPNIAHMDIILNLMNGKFNYQDAGILDNTHLKFFTRSSFCEWIKQINDTYNMNFDCEYLGSTFHRNDYIETIQKDFKELFDILECSKEATALQLLFKLTKIPQNEETTNLKYLLEDTDNNVVRLLGMALKGSKITTLSSLVRGERGLYEAVIKSYSENNSELQKSLQNAHEYVVSLEERSKQQLHWIEQIENQQSDLFKKIEEQINTDNEQKQMVSDLKSEISKLEQELSDIKSSRTWRIVRALKFWESKRTKNEVK